MVKRNAITGEYLKDFRIPDSKFLNFRKSLQKNMADSK